MPANESKRIFCNHCRSITNHKCVGEHLKEEVYEDKDLDNAVIEVMDISIYRLWICAGCEHGTMEVIEGINVLREPDVWESIKRNKDFFTFRYFPDLVFRRSEAKEFKRIPEKLKTIYHEMLHAYNNGANLLCAIGIRTLIEGIVADKKIRGKDLREKIDKMTGMLPSNIIIGIHKLRFIGNIAAHELNSPDEAELRLAIDICEDLLNVFYELEYKAKKLKKPRRKQYHRITKHSKRPPTTDNKGES